jgi:hypothetical protein
VRQISSISSSLRDWLPAFQFGFQDFEELVFSRRSTKLRNAKTTTRDGHNRPIVVATGMGAITSLGVVTGLCLGKAQRADYVETIMGGRFIVHLHFLSETDLRYGAGRPYILLSRPAI